MPSHTNVGTSCNIAPQVTLSNAVSFSIRVAFALRLRCPYMFVQAIRVETYVISPDHLTYWILFFGKPVCYMYNRFGFHNVYWITSNSVIIEVRCLTFFISAFLGRKSDRGLIGPVRPSIRPSVGFARTVNFFIF